MNVAAPMTWTHLFPSGVSYLCDAAPMWLVQMLKPYEHRSQPVRITWGSGRFPASPQPLAGQVIINGRGPGGSELAAAGFDYVRRFAVVPSLRNARWFIPLDSGAVSAAAFRLYTPARRSARLKQIIASAAARTRLPVWYRDHITIASRGVPPLQQAIDRLFPGADIRLALSAGAPEPARNRKPSIAVLDRRGKMLAIAKLGPSELSRRLLHHEAEVLKALPERGVIAPTLLFADDVDGCFLTVQSVVDGTPAQGEFTAEHRRLLTSLRHGSARPAAYSGLVVELRRRLASLGPSVDDLTHALDDLTPAMEALSVPATIVHGDFVPWNLRQRGGRIGAFDWEYAQIDGLPLIDETHFRLQVGFLISSWPEDRAVRCLTDLAATEPAGLKPTEARTLQCLYIIDMLARLLDEGYRPDEPMLIWYRNVLSRLCTEAREAALV